MNRPGLAVIAACAFSATAFADIPASTEEFIYSIFAYDGNKYSSTFTSQTRDSLFLIADRDNFLDPSKTFVYYWPITNDLRADTSALRIPFEGTLQIMDASGKTVIKEAERVPYTYFVLNRKSSTEFALTYGENANVVWKARQDEEAAYMKAISDYRREMTVFNFLLGRFTERITKMREEGKEIGKLVEELNSLTPPPQPKMSDTYYMPPIEPLSGYLINLPRGEYRIRFIDQSGSIMEGSEKLLIAFKAKEEDAVGYKIITSKDWTKPNEFPGNTSTIYVNGEHDLYVMVQTYSTFNDLYYSRLIKNDSIGNPYLTRRVMKEERNESRLSVAYDRGESIILAKEDYFVEQSHATAFGYEIVPYDPEGAHWNRSATFSSIRIPIRKNDRIVHISTLSAEGSLVPGSSRTIRILDSSPDNSLLYLVPILPLAIFLVIRIVRTTRRRHLHTVAR